MTMLIWQRFEFDAGHRVLGHKGKCQHLHGHRYVAEVGISTLNLDDLGMVLDFGEVKRIIGEWINTQWDHNMLLHENDPLLTVVSESPNYDDPEQVVFGSKSPYIMAKGNPTAENMALALLRVCVRLLEPDHPPLRVEEVVIWETPNCRAVAVRGEVR